MANATDFHSEIAERFKNNYSTSKSFIERYNVWQGLTSKYILPRQRVLDVGCGSGVFSFLMAENNCFVTGIDGANGMIDLCEEEAKKRNLNNIDFKLLQIPFSKDVFSIKFDAIISSSVLEYIEDINQTLNLLGGLIKDDGIMIISIPNKNSIYRFLELLLYKLIKKPAYYQYVKHVFTSKKFSTLLKKHGFDEVEITYYASNDPISKILTSFLPIQHTNSLFVGVYKKSALK